MLQVRAALDAAPFTGAEAVGLGLLDGLLYRTEAISTLQGLPVQQAAAPQGAAAGECGATLGSNGGLQGGLLYAQS